MHDNDDIENKSMVAEQGMVAMLNRSDIEQQIATAHKFPRSVKTFVNKASSLVTLNEETADDCIYALPRGQGKTIEGPSVRFAEIISHSWGNSRSGARVVDDTGKFVTSQGVFHDLETNVATTFEVQRRITDKQGRRYNDDMVGVTANAASSIAYRNAVLKGIPKALWQPIYEQARKLLLGDVRTLTSRRDTMLAYYQKLGVSPDKVFARLEVASIEDITLEHLLTLKGLATALKDGETSIEQTFPTAKTASNLNERLKGEPEPGATGAPETAGATGAEAGTSAEGATAAAKPRARKKPETEAPPAAAEKPATQVASDVSLGDQSIVVEPKAASSETEPVGAKGTGEFDIE